ncbi:MAG: acyltransferase [Pseudomonadota bacterium]|nr:acyltransferase [Pseudomonadota bacterium]
MAKTHTPTSPLTPPIYFRWIDGLRGAAAVIVAIFHYHHFYLADHASRSEIPDSATFPHAWLLQPIFDHGYWAVQLFWIISGFVFAHVYLPRPTTLRQFTVARIARLYPLHFATLIFVALLQFISLTAAGHWQIYGSNDLRHFLLQSVMASNLTTLNQGLSFNGPIWSVSLELAAYAAFLVSLAGIRRFPLLMPLICSAISFGISVSALDLPLLRLAAFTCAGYFFVGTALYGLCQQLGWNVFRLLGLGVLAAAGALLGWDALNSIARVVLVSVALLALLIVCDLTLPKIGQRLQPLGDLSYAIYLVHVPLQITCLLAIDLLWGNTRTFADSPWVLPIYLAFVILFAAIAHRRIEKPAGAWLRIKLSPQSLTTAAIVLPSRHSR